MSVLTSLLRSTLCLAAATALFTGCPDDAPAPEADPTEPNVLDIAFVGSKTTSGCLAYADGKWSVATTTWDDGAPVNKACALIPVLEDGELMWVSGADHSLLFQTSDYDDDDVQHSVSTAEDTVAAGTFPADLYKRDDDFDTATPKFSGEITVSDVDATAGTVTVKLIP